MKGKFFSIIIPAYNEEKYIGKAIKNILLLDYPKEKFEVIIIENGSTDKTYEKVKKFTNHNIKVFRNKEKGISKARNMGAMKSSSKAEWLVFLDADVLIKKEFLKELNNFLNKKRTEYVIGTTEIYPIKKSTRHLLWFKYHNLVHKLFHLSLSIQIVKKEFFKKVKYDKNLKFSEDIMLINKMEKYGKFFYMPTKNVEISTRRFDKEGGHLKVLLKWGYMNSLPYKIKIKKSYKDVRE